MPTQEKKIGTGIHGAPVLIQIQIRNEHALIDSQPREIKLGFIVKKEINKHKLILLRGRNVRIMYFTTILINHEQIAD